MNSLEQVLKESDDLGGTVFLSDLMEALKSEPELRLNVVLDLKHLKHGLKMIVGYDYYYVMLGGKGGTPWTVLGKIDPICDICIWCADVFNNSHKSTHLHKDLIEIVAL